MDPSLTDTSARSNRSSYLYRLLDAAIVIICGLAVTELKFSDEAMADPPQIHLFLIYLCGLGVIALFPAFRLYVSWRGRRLTDLVVRSLAAWALVFALGILVSFLMHQSAAVSRLWAATWFGSVALALAGVRLAAYTVLGAARDRGLDRKRVLLVGFGALGHDLWRRVERYREAGYEVAGIYAEAHENLPPQVRRLHELDALHGFVRENDVREVWIVLPMEAGQELREVLYHLRNDLVDIRWIPDVMSIQLLGHRIGEFLGLPAIQLNSLPAAGVRGLAKEAFDRAFALCALVGLSPVMLTVACLVKLTSRGPVLFTQPRLGVDGKVFHVYKFRTMTVHQEHGVVTQATRNDARITRIGGFLRRTSLDELPQFLNVLRGDMSVVGPRPHALEHNELYKDLVQRYMMRHRVKPGITGWAQVNGLRGQTDTLRKMSDRVEHDIYYIQHWTFRMDLIIIARTAVSGWTGRNVY
ncbi:MAG: undecaprenyl-phosphate glucose phosphotransferase [Achromobacter sp.]|jgi:putative colanic acid biosynthesis UDP-glucose lipid carrier transferase|uniref:UDP-glucose:undecaprenyl-phosphate glucose-1-phosphate transferase n=1 Tax=Achromobacter insuavis TaxID=1287735 RepID=A0A6J5HN19_9BURK|nr:MULTISPECIES: undecaprenyl-phosphate glucose phosphotransferase [Achromobacter]MBN9637256.1 undecaprenyl-phosphate glucose phosphotransferase [Achromobacter sp.]MCG2596852.1 undecaprenyl-phosphate glucose phosphotransferase [Achromobacter sp.]MCG2604825.1 undecaprenyl-phosphate glucose phosphotransferase [Achromobacter sp.]CAB3657266.1 UDP-glucose:undecaprenyl-phosphate glucose-1-phosphate transferase [Achromobacter insuavis]CAB3847343.1 UDP-glucose:undecaprenyl-phosphate glucose-1-phosphat